MVLDPNEVVGEEDQHQGVLPHRFGSLPHSACWHASCPQSGSHHETSSLPLPCELLQVHQGSKLQDAGSQASHDEVTIGLHGGHLPPLWEPEQPMDFSKSWTLYFGFRLAHSMQEKWIP